MTGGSPQRYYNTPEGGPFGARRMLGVLVPEVGGMSIREFFLS